MNRSTTLFLLLLSIAVIGPAHAQEQPEQTDQTAFISPECEAKFYELQERMTALNLNYEEMLIIESMVKETEISSNSAQAVTGVIAGRYLRDQTREMKMQHAAQPGLTTGKKFKNWGRRLPKTLLKWTAYFVAIEAIVGVVNDGTVRVTNHDEMQLKKDVDEYIYYCIPDFYDQSADQH